MTHLLIIALVLVLGLAIAESYRPVTVVPTTRVRIRSLKEEHDAGIQYLSFLGALILLLLIFFTIASFIWQPVVSRLWTENWYAAINLVFFATLILLPGSLIVSFILSILFQDAIRLFKAGGKAKAHCSIRPLACQRCNIRLKRLSQSALIEVLNPLEKIAMELGHVKFAAWHCPRCCSQPSEIDVHIRAYSKLSQDAQNRLFCEFCREFTISHTSRTIKPQIGEETGETLHTYTCRYCYRATRKTEFVYPRDDDATD